MKVSITRGGVEPLGWRRRSIVVPKPVETRSHGLRRASRCCALSGCLRSWSTNESSQFEGRDGAAFVDSLNSCIVSRHWPNSVKNLTSGTIFF